MSSADPEHHKGEEAPAGEDEDTGAQVAPIIKLEEVAISTGKEDEDVLLDLKSKLYRFDKDWNQWKERGEDTVRFLKHKVTGKVRLVMRQSKALKICANHFMVCLLHQGLIMLLLYMWSDTDLSLMEWSRPTQLGEIPTPRSGHVGVTVGENWFIVGHKTCMRVYEALVLS